MNKNRPLIEKVIEMRNKKQDPVTEFATRNKDSPLDVWDKFKPFTKKEFYLNLFTNIDGVKLKFRHTELTVNGRHKSK